MKTPLVLATGNPGKLNEMQPYLAGLNWELQLKPPELEIEETGETFLENARLKASSVARVMGRWAIAISRPDGSIALEVEGICRGEILEQPKGTGGFGYDPIFYVPEHQMTFAEMPPKLKQECSHRGRAFQALLPRFIEIQA